MTRATKILIADDHAIVRIGLAALLAPEKDLEVVGEAKDGTEAVRLAMRLKPDVIILDLMMPNLDGSAATERILKSLPDTKIVILTTFGTSDAIDRALKLGAVGAVMKNADDAELINIIRRIASGERYISPDIRRLIADHPPVSQLTERQTEVLESLTRGLTNTDIARQLGICEDRVKDHINAIFLKLGAANRAEAVAIALRKHLLKI